MMDARIRKGGLMAQIRTLPDEVARCIAAGEVVERPASVVKELVENALDAGANRITVTCGGAGVKLIEVTDNGSGMSREDISLSYHNFSTSKISLPEDLFRISTYGFRGEALASIAAVSRLEIISSDHTGGEGWTVSVEGKTELHSRPAAHEQGTTVRVRDLFYNTPARRKFLKSDLTERKRILEAILCFALISPDLELHYIDDGEHVIDCLPTSSWRERVAAVLGASTMKHMVEVDTSNGPMRVQGFASLPAYTRSHRANQFLYVNRRCVREKTIAHAVQDAYRNVIPPKRFPVLVLSILVPFVDVDANIHPRKLEVRIKNDRFVHETLRRAIKSALSGRVEPAMTAGISSPGQPQPQEAFEPRSAGMGFLADSRSGEGEGPYGDRRVISLKERIKNAYSEFLSRSAVTVDTGSQLSLTGADIETRTGDEAEASRERFLGEESLFWQFNNTYIFIQVRGGVVIIDQHAAHERIIFDTSKRQLEEEMQVSQQILFPIHLELSMSELEVFRSSQEIFRKLGFDLEPFGGKSILVRGCPQGLKNWNEGRLLLEIFDDIIRDAAPGETHTERVLASFACRSAIKAGQKLSVGEMRLLSDQLFAVENPYSCPHGRPTIQRITLEEIERWFSRR